MLLAHYYDGQAARRKEVCLSTDGLSVLIQGAGIDRAVPLSEIKVSEPLGSAPRLITFSDGAVCEVRDLPGLKQLLETAGYREGWLDAWQRSWKIALASMVLIAGVVAAAYVWGLPLAAAWGAGRMPPVVTRTLSQNTLASLDRVLLHPSVLTHERTDEIGRRFSALTRPGNGAGDETLLYRSSPVIGPNAFALPDGTLVLLDELVALADNDEQILAVLAHEAGHVYHKHGLRLLLQSSMVGAFVGWWLGDFSSMLAAVPAALAEARYSRNLESEADAYAATMLTANGIEPVRLAEMLEKLAHAHGLRAEKSSQWLDYLSSHPAPQERIQALRHR